MLNEASVIPCQAQESSDILNISGCWPILHCLDFVGSVATPALDMTCPKYSIFGYAEEHLDVLPKRL